MATADSSPSVCGQKMMKDKLRQEEEDWNCCFFLCAIVYSTIDPPLILLLLFVSLSPPLTQCKKPASSSCLRGEKKGFQMQASP